MPRLPVLSWGLVFIGMHPCGGVPATGVMSRTHSPNMKAGNSRVSEESKDSLLSFGAKPNDPAFNSRPAFQNALSTLARHAGGTLYIPKGQYYIDFPDIANDIDPRDPANREALRIRNLSREKLILVPPNVVIQGDTDSAGNPLTQIHWKATSFPIFSFVNSDHSGIKDIAFVFDGTQPEFFPWSQEQYLAVAGINTAHLGAPVEISTVIYTIGSEGLAFQNLAFSSSAKPADNEHTFALAFVSKGKGPIPDPVRAVISTMPLGTRIPGAALSDRVRGNVFRSLNFSEFVGGILASGQESPIFEKITGNYRGSWYRSLDPAHETGGKVQHLNGPGHIIYMTAQPVWDIAKSVEHPQGIPVVRTVVRSTNVTMRDITEGAETLSNVNSGGTLSLKNIDGGTIQNIRSQHPNGLINSMTDVHNVVLQDLTWNSNRDLCSEEEHRCDSVIAIHIAEGIFPGVEGFSDHLKFRNVTLRSARSAAIFKVSSTQTQDPSKMNHDIVVDGLTMEIAPYYPGDQKVPGGIVTVLAADIHFTHVTYSPLLQTGSLSTAVDNACQIWPGSVNVTMDLTVRRIEAPPVVSAAVYRCHISQHEPGTESVGLNNGCSITEHFVN